ncbi:MAG TPA: YfiR family protein [Aromatoleum sp.]|uniref:YfiR family protein n=1 Tax=Aromatoleum sp. TaxID=2307007 RepID=UPI002B47D3F9|nr:YfiR family protein [Aromatoleum sp.]HJV24184.1 YfiR family protein [Aromatoleum sp.]
MFAPAVLLRCAASPSAVRRRILVCLVLAGAAHAFAANDPVSVEYQVKAAYLFRMAEYIEWPSSAFAGPGEPIRIVVVGADPLVDILVATLAGRKANERSFVVEPSNGGDEVEHAHILFVARREAGAAKKLIGALKSRPVLTITEMPGGLDSGSVVNFVPVDNRIGFEISLGTAERNGLRLSSRLLAVARRVEKGAP